MKSKSGQPSGLLSSLKSAEVGSARWFWRKRLENPTLWIAPAMPLTMAAVAIKEQSAANPGEWVFFGLPWLAVGVTVGMLCHALWRIEVNLDGNERPFTEKDAKTFDRAYYAIVAVSAALALGYLGAGQLLQGALNVPGDPSSDAAFIPTLITIMLSMVTRSMGRVYSKGKAAHDELEKGV